MILRKPYAFLIKNFRKIHIFLLLICAFIFYQNSKIGQFISEFLDLGTYDMYNEPISKYINIFLILLLIIVIVLFVALVVLLKRKKKPWKLYLLPVIVYLSMLILFIFVSGYFNTYIGSGSKTLIRIFRDLLGIASFFQYPVFLILLIRIFGVDLNNFNFKMDQEYLELSSGDREEFEVNINVDKHSFIRTYRRLLRNLGYVYEEHKFIFNTVITVFVIIFIVSTYYTVFILHKSYKQGDYFDISGYSIKINNSYYTDKDYKGKTINKKNAFVILDLNIKNNVLARKVNFGRFHIMNGINNYTYTSRTYETDFDDLGNAYNEYEIRAGENKNLIMIFKVNKNEDKNGYVLYYQDYIKDQPYLRKIKLDMKDVSKIEKGNTYKEGDNITFQEGTKKKKITIDDIEISDNIGYSYQSCDIYNECQSEVKVVNALPNEKILKIEFISDDFEGKELIDFSSKYGKISYIDNKGERVTAKLKSAVDKNYMGQEMYIRVSDKFEKSKKQEIIYTIRNKKYIIKIK